MWRLMKRGIRSFDSRMCFSADTAALLVFLCSSPPRLNSAVTTCDRGWRKDVQLRRDEAARDSSTKQNTQRDADRERETHGHGRAPRSFGTK